MAAQTTDLQNARRQVIEAAREWANNLDEDGRLLCAVGDAVAKLERIEKDLAQ